MLVKYSTIKTTYDALVAKLRRNCGKKVRVPQLIHPAKRQYTVQGLCFVFFGMHVGKVMPKTELIKFLQHHGCRTHDPQPRHLGMQFGLDFMIMRSYHPKLKRTLRAGEYCLKSLSSVHPTASHINHRTVKLSDQVFKNLKRRFYSRCACCGSVEGEPNHKNMKIITTLEKGHRDPRKPLTSSNCIPICTVCNHVYANKVVFTARGFVKPL